MTFLASQPPRATRPLCGFARVALCAVAVAALLLGGCRCLDCEDDDPGGPETPARLQPWRSTTLSTERPIIGVHASPFEVLVFTENEFVRASQRVDPVTGEARLSVVDRRRFRSVLRGQGQPAVSDLAFARGVLDTETGEELIEFQAVQNAGGVAQLAIDSVRIDTTFDELAALASDGREIGAFSRDARVYAQPIVRRERRSLALVLIRLDYDRSFERVTDVEPFAVVDLPNVREEDRAISSVTFIDGLFYVATKSGGYRVTRGGEVEEVIDRFTGVRDFFKYEGAVYATREGPGGLLVSEDGVFFRNSALVQDFGVVDVIGEDVVVQRFGGWPYFVTDDLAAAPDSLALNRNFTRAQDAYFGLARLEGRYYLGLGRALYVSDTLATVPGM